MLYTYIIVASSVRRVIERKRFSKRKKTPWKREALQERGIRRRTSRGGIHVMYQVITVCVCVCVCVCVREIH